MKLRNLWLASVGTIALTAGAALAQQQIDTQALAAKYQADGYTRVEIKVGATQVKVEAIRGTTKIETIYDAATGAVLKTETSTVGAGENTTPGVKISNKSGSFLDDDESDDENDDESDDEDDDEKDDDDEDDDEDDDDDDEDDDE